MLFIFFFFFSSRRRHTRCLSDWSSDVCSSDLALDASAGKWPVDGVTAILCINMIHISQWAATVGLIEGAGDALPSGGVLFLYGPYRRGGVATAPSNEAFDTDLRSRNADWGLRQLEEIEVLARRHGFGAPAVIEMPANNLSVIFRKT